MVRERGRVIAHTEHVTLRNAHFVVQRSGYERTVRETGQKPHYAYGLGKERQETRLGKIAAWKVAVRRTLSGRRSGAYGRRGRL